MHVIGTAGHVDHGKSTLVSALTGINPDRLKEEQEREMTIDLGFAWLTLPGGEVLGIVDVPGHQDFIDNMLAGVVGIDAILFVVAADEGVMPQTREHLAILDLLKVKSGIIVLTKIDLVEDAEWLGMVEAEIHQLIRGTVLEDAPFVRVSARTRAGLDELLQSLADLIASQPARANMGRPRLPVDRAFSLRGFGTVVTGTLLDGEFKLGDEVEALPSGVTGRIRGLQSYKQKVQRSLPGSRTAINLSGIDLDQLERGDVISLPGTYRPTRRLDGQVRMAPDTHVPLNHGSQVKLFVGTSSRMARVRLLDAEEILPGQSGWIQMELAQPVIAAKDDRFILRWPSPAETIGGGVVVDPHPKGRHKRLSAAVIGHLELLKADSPKDILFRTIIASGGISIADCVRASNLKLEDLRSGLGELILENQVVLIGSSTPKDGQGINSQSDGFLLASRDWEDLTRRCQRELKTFHQGHPLKKGMPVEELKSRLKLTSRHFMPYVQEWSASGLLVEEENRIKLSSFMVTFSPQQGEAIQGLMDKFTLAPFAPPTYKECVEELGEELTDCLVEKGTLMAVSPEVVFRSSDLMTMLDRIRQRLAAQKNISLAQVRDEFGTSRKYALALMEYLDKIGVTIREGDIRRLRYE